MIFEFIEEHIILLLAVLIILLAIIAIAVIKVVLKGSSTQKELSRKAADKLRDENLNNIILNAHAPVEMQRDALCPYDVDYSGQGRAQSQKPVMNACADNGHIMLQIIEHTQLSARKFILNPILGIRIGSDMQGNDITVFTQGVAPHQCEIFAAQDQVYVRNLDPQYSTIVQRKNQSVTVDIRGIKLATNDRIFVGNVTYDINVIKN